jgi:hypothetical protein
MMGFEFEENTRPYSIDILMESVGIFIFEIVQAFVTTRKAYFIYNAAIGVFGLGLCGSTLFFDFKPTMKEEAEQLNVQSLTFKDFSENSKTMTNDTFRVDIN